MQLEPLIFGKNGADYLPYLEGALVSYRVWKHSTGGGFSVKEAQTGIITRISYNALGSGRITYAVFDILHSSGKIRVDISDPHLRIMQLANGAPITGSAEQYRIQLHDALRAAKRRAGKG